MATKAPNAPNAPMAGYEDDEQLQCRIEAAIEEDFENMFPIQNGLNDLMI